MTAAYVTARSKVTKQSLNMYRDFRVQNDVNSPTDRGCAVRSEGGFIPPRACT
ncbi:MAG: hypothetical protein LRY51_15260 [Geovibrio sp.]|nr:hypothetical protein [Geovibrio sp.]